MRKLTSILVITMLILIGFSLQTQPVAGQFSTNTPVSTSGGDSLPSAPNGFNFVTNTPLGPTSTPTNTPTNTATATATATNTSTPTATFTPSNTPSPTPTPNGPFSYPEGVNPLTGLPYPDEEAVLRRNLIVKISNFPPLVRPQHGVNAADIVYEYEAEGGVTRFAAIYRSQNPERVGSIRSARLMDIELATMYNALLAYSGTSEPIQDLLLTQPFFNFQLISPSVGHEENQSNNCDVAAFCRNDSLRDSGTPREHTLFGNTNGMWSIADRQGTNQGLIAFGFAFAEDTAVNGDGLPANDVFIEWFGQTDGRWQYNADDGIYQRFTDGQVHMDAADGEQLWADNLIIIEVPHVDRPDLFPAGATYTSLGIELFGQGRAYVIRDGQLYQGFWRRNENQALGQALQLIYGDNTPIMLSPGRTWVTVVRGLGNARIDEEYTDVNATATITALTPSPTPFDPNPDG
ncbi:MAG: DUF3048 domain-containing protein [Chloroflexota bacterium]